MDDYNLSEFLNLQGSITTIRNEEILPERTFIWSRESTLKLLSLYQKYRDKVGSFEIRSLKKLWEVISSELKTLYGIKVAPSNCENRWRVLERSYKKFIDNQNQTGAGRKCFEFANEMDSLLGKKKSIKPTVLISSETVTKPPTPQHDSNEPEPGESKENLAVEPPAQKKRKTTHRILRKPKKTRSDVLEGIRKDKEERFKQKVALYNKKFEKSLEFENQIIKLKIEKNALLKENNNLLKERNMLLRQQMSNNSFIDAEDYC